MSGKPSIQTVLLIVKPLNESFSAYALGFRGPSDTEIEFNGDTVEVVSGICLKPVKINLFCTNYSTLFIPVLKNDLHLYILFLKPTKC